MSSGEHGWREVARRVAGEAGYDLEDFAVVAAGRRRVVRVVVDSDDGVALDAAAEISRALSAAFDELDAAQGDSEPPYTLEVTSPGIGRPLTEPRHFRRARGRLLSVTLTDGSSVQARVLGITDTGVDVLGGRNGIEPAHLPFDSISRARVEVEFSPPSAAVTALLAADPRTAEFAARARAEHDAVSDDADDADDDDETDDDDDETDDDGDETDDDGPDEGAGDQGARDDGAGDEGADDDTDDHRTADPDEGTHR